MGNKAAVISSLFNYPVRSAFFFFIFLVLFYILHFHIYQHFVLFCFFPLFFFFVGQDYAGQVTSATGKEKIIISIKHIRLILTLLFLSIL